MKKIALYALFALFAGLFLSGCQDPYKVSYLNAKGLNYPSNTLTVVQGLTEEDMWEPQNSGAAPGGFPGFPGGSDVPGGEVQKTPSKYKARIENKAPWLSQPFWGATVEGSRPLTITIESVKTTGEGANAEILKKQVTIYGEGVIQVPFENDIPLGEYLLTLRIANISGYEIVPDCFTIIVTDKKWED